MTTLMQIHSVTKPKMKKLLGAIAKQENYRFSTSVLDEIHHQSNGDIRHAIMTLQLHAAGRPKAKSGTITFGNEGQNNRDTKLSTFHSLGKLLYAKRVLDANGDSRLAFDPETILQRSDLGVEGSLRFLEFHSADFFTDITELSRAYSSFSDVADMLGHATALGGSGDARNNGSGVFPYNCASSIAGRIVANTNAHPAPNKFRQFSRPKVFDVMRNGRQNQILLDQLSRRLLTTSRQIGSVSNFVTESLPFVRQISPQEVDPYLENLYSIAMQNHKDKLGHENNIEDDEELFLQKEQQALLEMDDINEFDSD
jgi:cell cycle checkpoint protein